MFVRVSFFVFVCVSVCVFVYVSICIFVCLPIHVFTNFLTVVGTVVTLNFSFWCELIILFFLIFFIKRSLDVGTSFLF